MRLKLLSVSFCRQVLSVLVRPPKMADIFRHTYQDGGLLSSYIIDRRREVFKLDDYYMFIIDVLRLSLVFVRFYRGE